MPEIGPVEVFGISFCVSVCSLRRLCCPPNRHLGPQQNGPSALQAPPKRLPGCGVYRSRLPNGIGRNVRIGFVDRLRVTGWRSQPGNGAAVHIDRAGHGPTGETQVFQGRAALRVQLNHRRLGRLPGAVVEARVAGIALFALLPGRALFPLGALFYLFSGVALVALSPGGGVLFEGILLSWSGFKDTTPSAPFSRGRPFSPFPRVACRPFSEGLGCPALRADLARPDTRLPLGPGSPGACRAGFSCAGSPFLPFRLSPFSPGGRGRLFLPGGLPAGALPDGDGGAASPPSRPRSSKSQVNASVFIQGKPGV